MKELIVFYIVFILFSFQVLALELNTVQTDDSKLAEALQKDKMAQKVPIEVRREELKKKHKNKKEMEAAKAASATTSAESIFNAVKDEQKNEDQREDNKFIH